QSPARATARASASARVAPPHAPAGPPPHMPASPPHAPASPPHAPASPPHAPAGPPPHMPGGPGARMPGGQPFDEFTTDVAGRGGASPFAPEQYSEHTTDVAGRQQPYVPAPALPVYPPPGGQPGGGDRSAISAAFAPRGTVTPPSPEDTTSWPGVEQHQSR